MVATIMRISEDLKSFINRIQEKLKREIQDHHAIYNMLKDDPKNMELEEKLKEIQKKIQGIGNEQQFAIHRIRLEIQEYGRKLQFNGLSHAIMGRATNLNNAIQVATNKIKKPPSTSTSPPPLLTTLPPPALPPPAPPPPPATVTPTTTTPIKTETPPAVISEESLDASSVHSPEPPTNPVAINELSQPQFLKYFGIVTHAVHDEMQKKRVERKRRSTANPQFFYGTKWEHTKRKRNSYLLSSMSPPHTRQAAKKAKERPVTPPSKDNSPRTGSPIDPKELSIPKLPLGLTIERVDPNRSTPDAKTCIMCSLQSKSLFICETCQNGFHLSCHSRPLTPQPRKCPKCIVEMEIRTIGSLNVPSDMTVSYVSTADLTEKLHEKQKLLEENKSLMAELLKLQDQHTQLTVSLKEQQVNQQTLLETQHTTEDKIKNLLNFLNRMKSPQVSSPH